MYTYENNDVQVCFFTYRLVQLLNTVKISPFTVYNIVKPWQESVVISADCAII